MSHSFDGNCSAMSNGRCPHTTDIHHGGHGGTRTREELSPRYRDYKVIGPMPPPPIPPIIQPWFCSTVMGGVSFPCDLRDLRVLRVKTLLFSAFLPNLCALCVRSGGHRVLEMAEVLQHFFHYYSFFAIFAIFAFQLPSAFFRTDHQHARKTRLNQPTPVTSRSARPA